MALTPDKRAKSPRPEGQAGKRTPEQALAHRAQVARWLREEPGFTVDQMALRLGISHTTAAKDRRWLLEQWRQSRQMDIEAHADAVYAAAATKAGVGRSTIFRWLARDEGFKEAVRAGQRQSESI